MKNELGASFGVRRLGAALVNVSLKCNQSGAKAPHSKEWPFFP